jgi:lysophospholipase L1-like esterase
VRKTLSTVGVNGCVIWATIVRPPVNGTSYRAANALLTRLAAEDPRLRVVPWAEQVAANPKLVGSDGVHATPAGYQLRAQLYAQAAQSCG